MIIKTAGLPVTSATPRMQLRKPSGKDFRQVYDILKNPEVMRFVTTGARSKSEAWKELEGWLESWEKFGFGPYLALNPENGGLMGFAKLYMSDRSKHLQIGYALDRPYWGQGLGTELAGACLQLGFDLGNSQIDAFAQVANTSSRNILRKVGMRCQTDSLIYASRVYAHYTITRGEYIYSLLTKVS